VGKNDWAGWGSGLEGPAIVQLDNVNTECTWIRSGGVPCQTMTALISTLGPPGEASRRSPSHRATARHQRHPTARITRQVRGSTRL